MYKKLIMLFLMLSIFGYLIFGYLVSVTTISGHGYSFIQINSFYKNMVEKTNVFGEASKYNEIAIDNYILENVKEQTSCIDIRKEHGILQWGGFWVIGNYVTASRTFKCEESLTFATTATYQFLQNLLPIVKRWKGPISVAVYAPGSDFLSTVDSIAYLRECETPLIQEFVSFHLFFETSYFPDKIPNYEALIPKDVNCSIPPPYQNYKKGSSFREQKKINFMVNTARNIARKMSETHFILSADIEMYPSEDFIPLFLTMVANGQAGIMPNRRVVYSIHAFEVNEGEEPPLNKTQLRDMFSRDVASAFHHKLCPICHDFPSLNLWMKENKTEMSIFSTVKRFGKFKAWEPFLVGTNEDPWFDERVSWEGMRDKRIQAYVLCLLDYEFLTPNNAFLVHKPGHKKTEYFGNRKEVSQHMAKTINQYYAPQYQKLYGNNPQCLV